MAHTPEQLQDLAAEVANMLADQIQQNPNAEGPGDLALTVAHLDRDVAKASVHFLIMVMAIATMSVKVLTTAHPYLTKEMNTEPWKTPDEPWNPDA